jgi:hypothetical protein
MNPGWAGDILRRQVKSPQSSTVLLSKGLHVVFSVAIMRWGVLFGGDKPTLYLPQLTCPCAIDEERQDGGFHASTNHSTAQQEGVNVTRVIYIMDDHYPHYPIISKAVAHPHSVHVPIRVLGHGADLLFTVAARGGVELVGFFG